MKQRPIVNFVYKAPVVLVGLFAFLYAVQLIINYKEDTTHITNAAFAIMASLSAITFTFAGAIENKELSDHITFAAERLLHGAVLVITASIIKYFIVELLKLPYFESAHWMEVSIRFTIGMLISLIFINGVLFAHTGLRILNDLLISRMTRHEDWDDLW